MTQSVGFGGMGIMGSAMVMNLAAAGYDPQIWNRSADKMTSLIKAGLRAAPDLESLAIQSDVLLLCLGDTPDVQEVAGRALKHMRPGSILVDHSTISPRATRELAEAALDVGVTWIDAPVSGGSEGAENATLSMMVGGPESRIAEVLPLLDAMATSVVRTGEAGSGQTTKLVNQILVVVNQLAVSEALLFADRAGLDLRTTLSAVSGGAAGSWMLSNRGPQMVEGFWDPGFTIDLQQKDLRLVLEASQELGLNLSATTLIHRLYGELQAQGLGSEGNHALIKALTDDSDDAFG